jgi:arylsulfatase A-like enzyme
MNSFWADSKTSAISALTGGVLVWLTYALAEYCATAIVPLWTYHNVTLASWHWKLNLVLFAAYSVAGLLTGVIAFIVMSVENQSSIDSGPRARAMATLVLTLAFVANLGVNALEPGTLAFAIAITGVLVWWIFLSRRPLPLRFVASPAGIVAALLGASLVNYAPSERSIALRLSAGVAECVVCIGLYFLATRISLHHRAWSRRAVRATAVGSTSAIVLYSALFVKANGGAAASTGAKSNRPNIVLITLDTVRADHTPLYGYARNTTPNLIALAHSATVYKNAKAAGDMTLTSHAAILTGTYGSWNQARSHVSPTSEHGRGIPLSRRYPTLAELLSKAGYGTAAVVANSGFLTPAWGFDRGFAQFNFKSALRVMPPGKDYCLRVGVRQVLHRLMDTSEFDMMFLRAEEINQEAYRLLDEQAGSGRPIFLFLNYMDAHSPYLPPAPFDSMFSGRDSSIADTRYEALFEGLVAGRDEITERERRHYTAEYDGAIAYMDAQVGDLIENLKRRGLYENTLLVITSDHGEALAEHNLIGHGLSVHSDQVDIPLIVKYPNSNERRTVDRLVGHTDIFPTALECAGIDPPKVLQGTSLSGGHPMNRALMSESFPSPGLVALNASFRRTQRALYEGEYKYIESTTGKRELYRITSDPKETHDICDSDHVRCMELRTELEAWRTTIPKTIPATGTRLDQQTIDRLRSLGYLGR